MISCSGKLTSKVSRSAACRHDPSRIQPIAVYNFRVFRRGKCHLPTANVMEFVQRKMGRKRKVVHAKHGVIFVRSRANV